MDMLAPALVALSSRERIDWSAWHVFWVDERWVVPVFNAPKPPPVRETMTLPVINHARRVAVAAGTSKAGIVVRLLQSGDEDSGIPVQRVKPVDGEMRWFLDETAYPPPLSRNSRDCNDE